MEELQPTPDIWLSASIAISDEVETRPHVRSTVLSNENWPYKQADHTSEHYLEKTTRTVVATLGPKTNGSGLTLQSGCIPSRLMAHFQQWMQRQ